MTTLSDDEVLAIVEYVEKKMRERMADIAEQLVTESFVRPLVDSITAQVDDHLSRMRFEIEEIRRVAKPIELTRVIRDENGDIDTTIRVHTDGQRQHLDELLRKR